MKKLEDIENAIKYQALGPAYKMAKNDFEENVKYFEENVVFRCITLMTTIFNYINLLGSISDP